MRGIANFAHFGSRYEPGPHATPSFVRRVHGFAVEEPPEEELLESCRHLFALWQREDLPLARRFAARFDTAVLLGGWYPVETYPDRVQRWTGERAEIFCPRGSRRIVLEGHTPSSTPLRVSFEGRVLHEEPVNGDFNLHLDLGDDSPGILSIEAAATYRGRRDARRLGVCLTRIAADDGRTERDLALAEDYATHLRKSDAAEWIGALIETTEGRSPEDDRPFQLSRGPHSRRFEEWLGTHVGSYDLVLAHGIPFSPAVAAGEAARAAGVPYVVLPHYHMDDRYYHWQHYYELFRGAELTLAAPDRSLPLFFDRIGARAVAVAGGGIDPGELADLAAARRAFRAVHDSPRPFVLGLGRKEANKGYHRVIAAVDLLRARGIDCEVVLIGPDSDSLPIESAAARYYANQPRSVVLGALAECACLATMSESESFGIVLVEAWACGKPVIANRACPAFAELIDDGHDGLLCGNEQEIAAALARLLAEPEIAARLGAAGKAKAFSRYSWERLAEAIEQALLTAAGRSRAGVKDGRHRPLSGA